MMMDIPPLRRQELLILYNVCVASNEFVVAHLEF